MDYDLFAPCDFTNIQGALHGYPPFFGDAIDEFPPFQGNDFFTAEAHLQNVSLYINKCLPYSKYEDVKMKIFILTLFGDAFDWYVKLPNNNFDSLQSIIDAFEDKYGDKDKVKEKVEVTKTIQVENYFKELIQMVKDIQLNQALVRKNVELNQAQLIKDKELNQARLTIDHAREINSMQSKLLALEEKMSIMEFNHSNQVTAMEASYQEEISLIQNRLSTMDEEMTIMRFNYNNQLDTMQANHKKEINYMQNCFMGMKAKNDKIIKDMEASQICLHNRLMTMEENHTKEVSAMKVEHSNQMDDITMEKIQVQKFQHQSEDERNKKMSIDHKPPYLLQQAPSYYEVICSIEK